MICLIYLNYLPNLFAYFINFMYFCSKKNIRSFNPNFLKFYNLLIFQFLNE